MGGGHEPGAGLNRALEIGLLTVRGEELFANRRLVQAASERGCRARMINPYEQTLTLDLQSGLGLPPVIIPRQGATLGRFCLSFITQCQVLGVCLVNGPRAIAQASDKYLSALRLARSGLAGLPTRLVATRRTALEAMAGLGGPPVVIKPRKGRQGRGVSLIEDQAAMELAAQLLIRRSEGMLVQSFVPPQGRRDLRFLVIGRRVAAAMELTPPPGGFKANFHQGGVAKPLDPAHPLGREALAAAEALGLEVAGVDIMLSPEYGPLISEVNYSPGFKALEKITGVDVAGAIVEHAMEMFKQCA